MKQPVKHNEPKQIVYLDIDDTSKCYESRDLLTINTVVSRPGFNHVKTYLIKSDAMQNKHSILCLITDGCDLSVYRNNGNVPLNFTVNKNDILDDADQRIGLALKKDDQLGIIVFNDRPNDFRMEYLTAIRAYYDEIFHFDADIPDVNAKKLDEVIKSVKKDKGFDAAPKEGQGGVIISGG